MPHYPVTFLVSIYHFLKVHFPLPLALLLEFDYADDISVSSHSQLANRKVRLKKQTLSWLLNDADKFWAVPHPTVLSIRESFIELLLHF